MSVRLICRPGCLSASVAAAVGTSDPIAEAKARGGGLAQFFLGDPQSWKKPKPREDADVLKASTTPLYVHAPYLINVASANNRVRIPSRKILQDTCDAAAEVAYTGDVNSIRVLSTTGAELANGITGARCLP